MIFEQTGEKFLNVNLPHFHKNIDTKNFHQIDFHPKKSEKKVCFWCQETIMQILQRPNRTEGALMKCFKDSFWTIVSTKKQNYVSFVVGHPNMLHSFHTYNYISPLY